MEEAASKGLEKKKKKRSEKESSSSSQAGGGCCRRLNNQWNATSPEESCVGVLFAARVAAQIPPFLQEWPFRFVTISCNLKKKKGGRKKKTKVYEEGAPAMTVCVVLCSPYLRDDWKADSIAS